MVNKYFLRRNSYLFYDKYNIFNTSIDDHMVGAGLIANGIISGWLKDEITPKSKITEQLNGAITKYLQYFIVDKVFHVSF